MRHAVRWGLGLVGIGLCGAVAWTLWRGGEGGEILVRSGSSPRPGEPVAVPTLIPVVSDPGEHRFELRVFGRRGDQVSPLAEARVEITLGTDEVVEGSVVRPLPGERLFVRADHPDHAPQPHREYVFEGGYQEEVVVLDALAAVDLQVTRESDRPLVGWWASTPDRDGRAERQALEVERAVRFERLLPGQPTVLEVAGGEVPFQVTVEPPLQPGELRSVTFLARDPAIIAGYWIPTPDFRRRDLYVLWTVGPPLAEVDGVAQYRATGPSWHRLPEEAGDAFRIGPFPDTEFGCHGVVLGAAWYGDGRVEFSHSEPFVLDRPRVIDVGLLRRSDTRFQVHFAAPPYDPERAEAPVDLSIRWPIPSDAPGRLGLNVVVSLPLVRGAAATILGLPPAVQCSVESALRGHAEYSTLTGVPFGPLDVTEVTPRWRRRN